jgi:hypothetical protein
MLRSAKVELMSVGGEKYSTTIQKIPMEEYKKMSEKADIIFTVDNEETGKYVVYGKDGDFDKEDLIKKGIEGYNNQK